MPPIVHEVLRSSGQPLDTATRAFFEPRFGYDFSHVRVHTDEKAAESARAVNALAYTVSGNVVFAAGRYNIGTAKGEELLAHELAHVVQQDQSGASRMGLSPYDDLRIGAADDLHEAEADAAAVGAIAGVPVVPRPARVVQLLQRVPDKTATGSQRGTLSFREATELATCIRIMGQANATYCEQEVLGVQPLQPASVPAPASQPSLRPVAGPFNVNACGVVRAGMDPALRQKTLSCIYHSQFVNFMTQSVANMRQVSSPYAPGLADVYGTALQQVVSAGQSKAPVPGSPVKYELNKLTLRISSSTSLPGLTFALQLVQNGPQGGNGAYTPILGGIELNENSGAAVLGNQVDIERTMYHEGVHFFSAVVTDANFQARRSSPPGTMIHRELDQSLTSAYQKQFFVVVTPLWQSALKTVTRNPAATLSSPTAATLATLQWFRVGNEILSRVEEAAYLALRSGRGFSESDLRATPQDWLYTVDYWDPTNQFDRASFDQFLQTNRSLIDSNVLPLIQFIQLDYLRIRPVT